MIRLPKGAFMLLQDEAEIKEKTAISSLILSMDEIDKKPEKPNTGKIIFTSQELNEFHGCKAVVRLNYADPDPIVIDGISYLFFRDFESSIYYVNTNKG
jgi:hypothetical protein